MLSTIFALCLACSSPTGPDTPTADEDPRIAAIQVTPGSAQLEPRESRQFRADVRDVNGNPVAATIEWRATGGTIDARGNYVAGTSPGLYEIRAISLGDLIGIARIRIDSLLDEANDSPDTGDDGAGSDEDSTGSDGTADPAPSDSGDAPDGTGEPDSTGSDDETTDDGGVTGSDPDGSPDASDPTGSPPPPPPVTIELSPTQTEVEVERTVRFRATLRAADGTAVDGTISFAATGGTITSDGTYTAGSRAGQFRVTARSGDLAATAYVRVTTPPPASLEISPTEADLEFGESLSFDATLRDDRGSVVDGTISFEATGGSITSGGTYTAGSRAGQFRVTARSGELSATAHVRVTAPAPASLEISPTQADLEPGESLTFEATLRDADGAEVDGTVDFEATGGAITSGGTYTAGQQAGQFRVTASHGSLRAAADIRISVPTSGDATSSDATIQPGESIQAAVDANPAGTTFTIAAGIHRGQSIEPKDGMTFVGEAGAVLDGGESTRHAFYGKAADVTIRGLEIRNYANPAQEGAIQAGGHHKSDGSEGWLIEDNEVHHNGGVGIRVGNRTVVRNNYVHHNHQLGIGGVGDDVLVEGNEIAYNNWLKEYSYGWEAGGTKFVKTRGLVVRNNHSHHNWGPGLWTDIDNIDSLIEGNVVEHNADTGIFHEISYAAVIRNNTVRDNGWDKAAWAYGAGILIAHSPDVEVYGNVLSNNYNGIMGVQQDRGSGAHGPHELRNLQVRDNQIVQHTGLWAAGTVQDIDDKGVFDRGITFESNRYDLQLEKPFAWDNDNLRPNEWQAFGHDRSGTFD